MGQDGRRGRKLRFIEASIVGTTAAGISAEMALRLSEALGTSPELWLGMQMQYDLWQASKKRRQKVRRLPKLTGSIAHDIVQPGIAAER